MKGIVLICGRAFKYPSGSVCLFKEDDSVGVHGSSVCMALADKQEWYHEDGVYEMLVDELPECASYLDKGVRASLVLRIENET